MVEGMLQGQFEVDSSQRLSLTCTRGLAITN